MVKPEIHQSLTSSEPGVQELVSKLYELIAQNQKQQEYLFVEDAAKILRCHPQTVYSYISSGRLKAVKRTKRNYIAKADLEAFMAGAEPPEQPRLLINKKGGGKNAGF
ncbi:MAG: helix-turn-helix domain-containing protein [Bacteroidota bacterium]|jgi:excisionase family DNA binding protein